MAKGEDLELKRRTAPKGSEKRGQKSGQNVPEGESKGKGQLPAYQSNRAFFPGRIDRPLGNTRDGPPNNQRGYTIDTGSRTTLGTTLPGGWPVILEGTVFRHPLGRLFFRASNCFNSAQARKPIGLECRDRSFSVRLRVKQVTQYVNFLVRVGV
jgi:hypothetical protein